MNEPDIKYPTIKATGDAELIDFKLDGKQLTIRVKLWDEQEWVVTAEGVKDFKNNTTHNIEALVSMPELDDETHKGYGLISPEANDDVTMSFKAESIKL